MFYGVSSRLNAFRLFLTLLLLALLLSRLNFSIFQGDLLLLALIKALE